MIADTNARLADVRQPILIVQATADNIVPPRNARLIHDGVSSPDRRIVMLDDCYHVITVDFARVFYFSLTLMNCARAGALYASDPATAAESPFADVQSAALSDATNINPQPTITSVNGVDGSGRAYVAVTASYSFNTVTNFPVIPSQLQLARTVKMFVAANTPNAN